MSRSSPALHKRITAMGSGHRRMSPWLLFAPLALAGACTDANLYHVTDVPAEPNKVTFTGQVCTDNPAERQFPLKVLFLVDASPQTPPGLPGGDVSTLVLRRSQAVRDAVTVLRGPDVEFALVRYGGQAFLSPDGGFTNTTQLINEAAGALTAPVPCQAGCRRTGAALSLASSVITGDLLSATRGLRSRTSYVIVHLQSGPTDDAVLDLQADATCVQQCPDTLDDQTRNSCRAACTLPKRIADLREFVLDNGAAEFLYHTLDVSQLGDQPEWRDLTEGELTLYTFAGGGEYRPVCRRNDDDTISPPGCGTQSTSFLSLSIQSARNVFIKKSLIVSNLNARHTNEGEVPDSDRDGLTDTEEQDLGTSATSRDTDGDGIGDKIEVLLSTVGLDPLSADSPPVCINVPAITTDTDGDGLTDCEEMLLRLDPTLFDSDADGFNDLIEVLWDTNFLQNDTLIDSDFDGSENGAELQAHSDPRSADAETRAALSYLYREEDLGIREVRFSTQPREISGVVVEDVGPATALGNGLLVYILRDPPVLAWRDPDDDIVGEGIEITEAGTYTLFTGCAPPGAVPAQNNVTAPDGSVDNDDKAPDACSGKYINVSVTPQILPPYPIDEFLRVDSAERQCIDFRVRNVTLVETLAADGRPRGNNDIRIFFGQVPQDRPEAFGIYRVAQFSYTYLSPDVKEPDISDQLVEPFRFVLFGDQ